MSAGPQISFMPRVWSDIADCMEFVARQPRGALRKREMELHAAFERIRSEPLARPITGYAAGTGIALRRYPVRQFDVIYAYFPATEASPSGLVSIRAIRHRRTQHVLRGVRECADSAGAAVPLRTADSGAEDYQT
jgi:hypothetical protein